MLFYGRELRQQQVVDATTGRPLGRVTRVIWDPSSGQLLGLKVGDGPQADQVVRPQQITAIEPGVITVVPPTDLPGPASHPAAIGKRLETPDGVVHGVVTDVVFDLATGQVLGFEIEPPGTCRAIVPALGTVHEEAERIVVEPQAVEAMASDLSALMAMRDPETGAILFPLSEEPLED